MDNRVYACVCAGKPGVCIAEGLDSSVDAFVRQIRDLGWQKMTVKHRQRAALGVPQPAATTTSKGTMQTTDAQREERAS
jgi:hypothetical protein